MQHGKKFALVDCNNFFVSCEQLFNPRLRKKPVVVLSRNDGCVIARSQEAKKLGIPMGAPLFQYEELFRQHGVHRYSSNFSLYSDISSRVMHTIQQCVPDVEVYSIDEAFFIVPDGVNVTDFCLELVVMIRQHVGIPVTIGVGYTKTLAKIATEYAKKRNDCVFDSTAVDRDHLLQTIPVSDIWGIGRRYSKKMLVKGIRTAYDFAYAPKELIKKWCTINGAKTQAELQGISCLPLAHIREPKQSITVSRSFGNAITDKSLLVEAVATFAESAARELRAQKSSAFHVSVFVLYSSYHDATRYYTSASYAFSEAVSYTPDIIAAARVCIDRLYTQGTRYKKAGILLADIAQEKSKQLHILAQAPNQKKQHLMQTCDTINKKWGHETIASAAAGVKQRQKIWKAKSLHKSACYTTSWHELLTIDLQREG